MTGSGTQGDPFIIGDVDDLQAIEDNLTSYYELGGDIDASATSGWNAGAGFAPISYFRGNFDGKGFTISDLFINRPSSNNNGLFGYIGTTLEIKDVTLTDFIITGDDFIGSLAGQFDDGGTISGITITNCTIAGDGTIGGIVGIIWDAVVSDCHSSGSISVTRNGCGGLAAEIQGGSVTDCSSSCSIDATGVPSSWHGYGGLLGQCTVDVTNSYATGAVVGNAYTQYMGGFVGYLYNASVGLVTINKCYATGNVSGRRQGGGFVGRLFTSGGGSVLTKNCYARGSITMLESTSGGFCGEQYSDGTIDDCYSTGTATGDSLVGGFCGDNDGTITNCFWDTETSSNATSDGGTGKTTTQMKTEATFTDAGWNFTTIWSINVSINDGYPNLLSLVISIQLSGIVWVETTKTHWIDENQVEQSFEGSLVGAGSNPEGTYWAEGTYYHYIDEDGDERRQEGTLVDAGSNPEGTRWVEGAYLHYIDASGDERYL